MKNKNKQFMQTLLLGTRPILELLISSSSWNKRICISIINIREIKAGENKIVTVFIVDKR